MRVDSVTKKWIRNEADERAVANGCRFSEERAEHFLNFVEENCCIYEGEYAGQLIRLMEWQVDAFSRLFGWEKHSAHWGRWVRRFRKGGIWLPKKNGKSPSLACCGLYLTCADGERGQKVYSTAKDGQQARIAHQHAFQMVTLSPRLKEECSLNKSSLRITHEPTASWYDILSGDNISGQEGRNGCVLVDEAHVVDERLAKVLEYAGISRSEGLQLLFSTAGNNIDGWGKKQQDYGRSVNEGQILDDEYFCLLHEAPQDATDDECSDPATWKKANPSYGYLLNEEEFRSSCERAKQSIDDFRTFKMYRLNIWSHGASPFLRQDDWRRCAAQFTEHELAGQQTFVGLDLSQTKDMTAAVFMFPRGDKEVWQLPFFWMPEEEARRKNHLAGYLAWHTAGFLRLTPGNVVDYQVVEDDLCGLIKLFRTKEIVYDRHYAENITQRIVDRTGVERVEFPQTMMNFTGPTSEYERRVINGTLKHPNHLVLNWQAGHVEVKSDNNANRRPIKPEYNNHKKIDGIVAGIMALARVMVYEAEGESVYSTRGLLTL